MKKELSILELEFTSSLKIMRIDVLSKILEKGSILLSELVDETVKKKWTSFNDKFQKAKHLLKNIQFLSKKGIDALNKKSSKDSLSFFDQIVDQLQGYEV